MHKLPLEFSSEALASGDFDESWSVGSGSQQTSCAIPPEFGGSGNGSSPEDFFLQALMNCFVGTFKVYANASKISFSRVQVNGRLIVDQDSGRKVVMKTAILEINIYGVDRRDRAETIALKALRDGFILNSVKTEIQHSLHIFDSSPV